MASGTSIEQLGFTEWQLWLKTARDLTAAHCFYTSPVCELETSLLIPAAVYIAWTSSLSWIVTFSLSWISFQSCLHYFHTFYPWKMQEDTPGARFTSAVITVIFEVCWICVCFVCACIFLYAHVCECMYGWMCALLLQVQWSVYISPLLLWPSGGRRLIWLCWFCRVTPEHWPSSGGLTTAPRWEPSPPPHTFCPVYCSLFRAPAPLLMSLCCCLQCVKLQGFQTNHVKCNCTWLPCVFLEDPAKMAGHTYLSRRLSSLQHPLIIQYVKGCMYVAFYIRLRGCGFFCPILCAFLLKSSPL